MSTISITAARIRRIREAMNLSRPKFSDLLDVPPTTLKNYELGYREVGGDFLIKMGKKFGGETVLWVMDVALIDEKNIDGHAKKLNDKLTAEGIVLRHRGDGYARTNI